MRRPLASARWLGAQRLHRGRGVSDMHPRTRQRTVMRLVGATHASPSVIRANGCGLGITTGAGRSVTAPVCGNGPSCAGGATHASPSVIGTNGCGLGLHRGAGAKMVPVRVNGPSCAGRGDACVALCHRHEWLWARVTPARGPQTWSPYASTDRHALVGATHASPSLIPRNGWCCGTACRPHASAKTPWRRGQRTGRIGPSSAA